MGPKKIGKSGNENPATRSLVANKWLEKPQQGFFKSLQNGSKLTPPVSDDPDEMQTALRNTAANNLVSWLEKDETLCLDSWQTYSQIDDEMVQEAILAEVNTQLRLGGKDALSTYFAWLGAAKTSLNSTIEQHLGDIRQLSHKGQIVALALLEPTEANILALQKTIREDNLLDIANGHGFDAHPVLVNVTLCLLIGEEQAAHAAQSAGQSSSKVLLQGPSTWEVPALTAFIKQARVRLINCPYIPYRFQWQNGDTLLSTDPTKFELMTSTKWAVFPRSEQAGKLITCESGIAIAKVEQLMGEDSQAELQLVGGYTGRSDIQHSIRINGDTAQSGSDIAGGLMERTVRQQHRASLS